MIEEFREVCQNPFLPEGRGRVENKCWRCESTDEERTIRKCVICYKYYCNECQADRNGRTFCSKQCADFFFFGDED
jgi:hypothetical protein